MTEVTDTSDSITSITDETIPLVFLTRFQLIYYGYM